MDLLFPKRETLAIMPFVKSAIFSLSLVGLFVVVPFYYWRGVNSPVGGSNEAVSITLQKGQGVSEIAEILKEKGLIRSPLVFKAYVFLHGFSNSLQAGDYEFSPKENLKELVSELQHGTFDVKLTFLEGWRVEEMADYLSSSGKLGFSGVDFAEAAKGKEGKLFPDTYLVPKYISASDLVSLMVSNFNSQMASKQDLIKASGMSLDDVVNLASIVERETQHEEDRALVAGILIKRMEKEWPIQADATLQYVLGFQTEADNKTGELKGSWWKKDLTKGDLALESPYNTRISGGLPPTPISNPGLTSIDAVLQPKSSDFWYYLSDREGNMHYAVTLEEHAANIEKYLP